MLGQLKTAPSSLSVFLKWWDWFLSLVTFRCTDRHGYLRDNYSSDYFQQIFFFEILQEEEWTKLITIIIIHCTIARIIRNYFIYFALALAVQSHVVKISRCPCLLIFKALLVLHCNSEGFYRRGIPSFFFLSLGHWVAAACCRCCNYLPAVRSERRCVRRSSTCY